MSMSATSTWAERPELQHEVTVPHTYAKDGRPEHFMVKRDGQFVCSVCTGETPIAKTIEPYPGK